MDKKKKIIKSLVWKELETLKYKKHIRFNWGKKGFILTRTFYG